MSRQPVQESLITFAERLMSVPAAPFFEMGVRRDAERIAQENGLDSRPDQFGNLWVHFQSSRQVRPLVLSAHLDHPGFESDVQK